MTTSPNPLVGSRGTYEIIEIIYSKRAPSPDRFSEILERATVFREPIQPTREPIPLTPSRVKKSSLRPIVETP